MAKLAVLSGTEGIDGHGLIVMDEVIKYDDASWHYGGEFPSDLPAEAAATHIGMFMAWVLLSGMASDWYRTEFAAELSLLRERKLTPGAYLVQTIGGKLTSEDFDEAGNRFAKAYYAPMKLYVRDYSGIAAPGLPTDYHASDSWETFDRLKPRFDQRFREWQAGTLPAE